MRMSAVADNLSLCPSYHIGVQRVLSSACHLPSSNTSRFSGSCWAMLPWPDEGPSGEKRRTEMVVEDGD